MKPALAALALLVGCAPVTPVSAPAPLTTVTVRSDSHCAVAVRVVQDGRPLAGPVYVNATATRTVQLPAQESAALVAVTPTACHGTDPYVLGPVRFSERGALLVRLDNLTALSTVVPQP